MFNDSAMIGYFDLTMIEEAWIGDTNIKKYGLCKVYVHGDEGMIPHFHIENNESNDICVCISESKYFKHGKYKDTFPSNKQTKMLDYWLRQPNNVDTDKSNWEMCILAWKLENPDWIIKNKHIKFPTKQPDYSKLVNFK